MVNYRFARKKLVNYLRDEVGIENTLVLEGFLNVPREFFIDSALWGMAYKDVALPIGNNQTISKPSTIAKMLAASSINKDSRVLEIGTGSGYQTALLAYIAKEVFTIEIFDNLLQNAKKRLEDLGFLNIRFKVGNGIEGWQNFSPFDTIIISAFLPDVPYNLAKQLTEDGKIIFPMGDENKQDIYSLQVIEDKFLLNKIDTCLFVPFLNGGNSEDFKKII